jgi:hypothetical protein
VGDCRKRGDIRRSNPRLLAAFALHPPKTWAFEVLERLPPGCSTEALREAEQHHIDRLRSRLPEFGFNIAPATWTDGPAQCADGIPPPALFSLAELPDDVLLTEYEAAAVGRWSTNSLAAWRRRSDHLLQWEFVAGKFIRYRAGALKRFLAAPIKRRGRPPKRRIEQPSVVPQPPTKDVADQQRVIRKLSARRRERLR